MKTGLNKREKIMILGAAIFVLIFLSFNYMIIPLNKQYIQKTEEYDSLDMERELVESKFNNEALTYVGHQRGEEAFNEIKKDYPFVMPNEQLDSILTKICLDNRLTPVTLGISDAEDFVLKKPDEETEEEVEEENIPNESEESEETAPPSALLVVTATMTLRGEYNSIKNLIDEIDKIDYIRISRLTFSLNNDTPTTNMPNISIFFEITMLNNAS